MKTIIAFVFLITFKTFAVSIAPASCSKNTMGMYYEIINYINSSNENLTAVKRAVVFTRYEIWLRDFVFDRNSRRSEFYTHMSQVNQFIFDTSSWTNQQAFDFLFNNRAQ